MPYIGANEDTSGAFDEILKFITNKYPLFVTALLQVFFVAMQPLFIVNHRIFPMLVTGFLISLIWTLNVKRVAFGGWSDRITYATGAMIGTLFGYLISDYIIRFL